VDGVKPAPKADLTEGQTAGKRMRGASPIAERFLACENVSKPARTTMSVQPSTFQPGAARHLFLRFVTVLLFGVSCSVRADMTWVYAVQISATIQTDPPQIDLRWPPDELGANSYVVRRKLKTDNSWGPGITLPGSTTNFTDTNVSIGSAYEYQVVKHATLGYTGYGYIYSAIDGPLIENRGTLLLIVAADTLALSNELARLQTDLVGDGWSVVRQNVSSNDSPESVKQFVTAQYLEKQENLQAVFLFGHVPVVMSGKLDYDSHGARPLPADGFYADMSGNWHLELNPTNRPSYFPAPVKLMIGRVDFFDMPGLRGSVRWPNETELLRRYLNKDHDWRHKQVDVPRRALMANRVGDYGGQAYAASGYRNFEPLVGPSNVVEVDVSDAAPPGQRWISLASRGSWLWSYGCGGGQDDIISQLGTNAPYHDLWSSDIVSQDAKVVFSMFFGSHFGDWTRTDNLMRAALASPTVGLTACIVGLPHWFFHHMAMGEPIGYAARLTMNNTNLYQNQSNALTRAIFINLLGDPALRMEPIAPPSALAAVGSHGQAKLSWSASPDRVLGYHVYRSASPDGPFSRLTGLLVTNTTYNDTSPFSSARTYMVRAVARQTNPSGSFFNPSQGVFVQTEAGPSGALATTVSASLVPGGIALSWDSQTGSIYHVESKASLSETLWTNISGQLNAASSELNFIDTNSVSFRARFYRVVSE
jgi:hypothetical protein